MPIAKLNEINHKATRDLGHLLLAVPSLRGVPRFFGTMAVGKSSEPTSGNVTEHFGGSVGQGSKCRIWWLYVAAFYHALCTTLILTPDLSELTLFRYLVYLHFWVAHPMCHTGSRMRNRDLFPWRICNYSIDNCAQSRKRK